MAVNVKITLDPARYLRTLGKLSPKTHPEFFSAYLKEMAFTTQREAARGIKRGGKAPPVKGRLTSRTGTGRRSIIADVSGVPKFSRVVTGLNYMALHEFGGTVSVPSTTVRAHTRSVVFGRRVAPFTVPSHIRKSHSATFPPRPWLKPATDKTAKLGPAIAAKHWERQIK